VGRPRIRKRRKLERQNESKEEMECSGIQITGRLKERWRDQLHVQGSDSDS
jgi:hypothetical protein